MKYAIRISLIIAFLFANCSLCFATGGYKNQVATIALFYDKMVDTNKQTISDFYELFNKDDESELDLQIGNQKPVDLEKIDAIMTNPSKHTSRFLECIKAKVPQFRNKIKKYRIELPPITKQGMREFNVIVNGEKFIFLFSGEDAFIENIYLPTGRLISDLTDVCK